MLKCVKPICLDKRVSSGGHRMLTKIHSVEGFAESSCTIAVVLNLMLKITLFNDFWSQIAQKSKFSQKDNENAIKGQFLMQFLQKKIQLY